MKGFLKRFSPLIVLVCLAAAQTIGMDRGRVEKTLPAGFIQDTTRRDSTRRDTILYKNIFTRFANPDTSLLAGDGGDLFQAVEADSNFIHPRDTMRAPDSLRLTDTFRYRYYVALRDSLTHINTRDSLLAAGDTLLSHFLDSVYVADSIAFARAEFEKWYAGLSKEERKKYDYNVKMARDRKILDSLQTIKDAETARRDSIREYTPRILETFAVTDSLQYKRLLTWHHDRDFHKMETYEYDTTYNYWFYDYPIFRKDVNATWLGVAGSPSQSYNWFKRDYREGVSFYEPYEDWSFSPSTLTFYNTKTPYTELSYFGTFFANRDKESDNLHILTTQNILPGLNYALEYNRYGGGGMLNHETTRNKNFTASANYLGKKYMAHVGFIQNNVSRQENGGVKYRYAVADTTLDAREMTVLMNSAQSETKKTTIFLDQQLRIPFNFLVPSQEKLDKRADDAYRDSVLLTGDKTAIAHIDEHLERVRAKRERERAETLEVADAGESHKSITTGFIGHSSEFSVYRRNYQDALRESDSLLNHLLGNRYINPVNSADSQRVMKLENKVFLRLQPWSEDGIVSKLDAGVGSKIMNYYLQEPSLLYNQRNEKWNSAYFYAGAEGQFRNYLNWSADGRYTFAGKEQNDFQLGADASLRFYPFRKARHSPVSVSARFQTSLKEPDFYWQHYVSNHFKWENDFNKISTSRIEASIAVPRWKLLAEAGYALVDNNIYLDENCMVRQNSTPMSIFSASLTKNFTVFDLLHFDNKVLFQASSNQAVVPVPTLAFNLRYYIQFDVQKNVMQMQLGANAWVNTKYYSPGWNPAIGAFYNQNVAKYNNGPLFDVFVNIQWKRACIFVKLENAGQGWPMDKADYFTAHNYIRTQRAFKFGIYWPFYTQPVLNQQVKAGGKN